MNKMKEPKKNKLKYINFDNLFEDNRFIGILSIVISFTIWLGMSMSTEEKFTKKITDIPITISLSEEATKENLKVFSSTETKAEVSVTGNRISIGSLTASDIQILAQQASSINSPGNYTLELSSKKVGVKSDYDFTSTINPSFIIVTVDRYREKTFTINNNLTYNIKDGYYEAATIYSHSEVIVSGPESEVSKVAQVVVAGKINDELYETITENHKLLMLDEYGEIINSEMLSLNIDYVDVTLPIGFKKTLPLSVAIKNGNNYIVNSDIINIQPSTIEISAPKDEINNVDDFEIGVIDLSKVNLLTKSQEFTIELPAGWKNIGNINSATVTFNTNNYLEKKVVIDKFNFINLDAKSKAKALTQNLEITLVGRSDILKNIDSDNINVYVDLGAKGKGYNGTVELPVIINISGTSNCWAYGDYYCGVEISSTLD